MLRTEIEQGDYNKRPYRPMARLGLLLCFSFFAAALCPFRLEICTAMVFAITSAILWPLRKRFHLTSICISFFIIGLSFGYFSAYTAFCYFPAVAYDGEIVSIDGKITEIENLDGGTFCYTIKVDSIDDHHFLLPFSAILYSQDELKADYNDQISSIVTVRATGEEDSLTLQDYQRSSGIFLEATLSDEVSIQTSNGFSFRKACLHLRDKLVASLDLYTHSPNSNVAAGIIFGKKDGIPFSIIEQYRKAGYSHLLAVSGLHMTMLVSVILMLLTLFKIPAKPSKIIAFLVLTAFSIMAGLSPSVCRALVMFTITFLASFLRRQTDGLNTLGFTAFILLLFSPYSVMNLSFLLSFAATLGILILSPKLSKMGKNYLYKDQADEINTPILDSFMVSLSATIFTLPISLFAFNYISLIAPISNIVAAPLSSLVLLLGLLTALFGLVCQPIALIFGFLTDTFTYWLNGISSWFANLPFATLPLKFPYLPLCLLLSICILIICYFSRRKKAAIKTGALLCCVIFLVGHLSYQFFNRNTVQLDILGNSTGYSIVLSYGRHAAVISCGGSKYSGENTYNFLTGMGIKQIDLLVLPDLTKETASGAPFLVRYEPVANIVMPLEGSMASQVLLSAQEQNTSVFELATMTVDIGSLHLLVDNRFSSPLILLTIGGTTMCYCDDAEIIAQTENDYQPDIILIQDDKFSSDLAFSSQYVILLSDKAHPSLNALQITTDTEKRSFHFIP